MNKRQKKKNKKKYIPIIADEINLLTMTSKEKEKAFADYNAFKEKYAFRKKYKDLKNSKPLRYFFPIGKEYHDRLTKINKITMGGNAEPITITQDISDIQNK